MSTPTQLDPGWRARVLAETAPDPILTIDEASTILSVNPAAERVFGYAAAEMIGQPLQMLMPERLRAGHAAGMARYLATGVRRIPWQGLRLPLLTKAGVELPIEVSFGEFVADGRRFFSGFLRDVSERVASEQALGEAHARLQAQAAALAAANEELHATAAALEEQAEGARDAAAAHRESEERYRRLFEDSPFPMFLLDIETLHFMEVNRAAVARYGYSPDEFRTLKVLDLRDPATLPDLQSALERIRGEGRIERVGTRHRTKAGVCLDVEVTAQHVTLGGRRVRVVVVNDVTARTRAEERTSRLQQVTAALSEAVTPAAVAAVVIEQGVAALGAQAGVVAAFHPAAEGAGGHETESLLGPDGERGHDGGVLRLLRTTGYPDDIMARWAEIPIAAPVPVADAVRTGEAIFLESREAWARRYPMAGPLLLRADSRSWAAIPLVVRGRVLGVMGLSFAAPNTFPLEDRAFALALAQQCAQALERAQLFAAEHAARLEAEAANQAKSQFLAVMSHELRTPLNAIGGYAQLIDLGLHGPVTDAQRGALERVTRAQQHLLRLINDVLHYARLEGGQIVYDHGPVLVRDVVAEVRPMVEPQLAAKGLALDVRLPEDPGAPAVWVWADRGRLAQVLLNLLSNAAKFTPPGGRVTIEFTEEIDGSAPAEFVSLTVADTGVGIPADKLEAIFDPFVQVGVGYTREAGGAGLGLAIGRELARGMGGDLRAQSVEGHGSRFTLMLRRATPSDGVPTGGTPAEWQVADEHPAGVAPGAGRRRRGE